MQEQHHISALPGDNILRRAARQDNADIARVIIRQQPELARELNEQGQSPLHVAVAHCHRFIVRALIQADSNLCSLRENRRGWTPVHLAANKGVVSVIGDLINASPEAMRTYRGQTPFHMAVKGNCPVAVKFLVGAQSHMLNAQDNDGNTGLHLAVARGLVPVIDYLLSCTGININLTNTRGLTPLDALSASNHDSRTIFDLTEMIRDAGGNHAEELNNRGSSLNFLSGNTHNDAGVLLVVATLVATLTFEASLNPPGGTINLPYEIGDHTNRTWSTSWRNPHPAGMPVLLWKLKAFFLLDTAALFASVTTILFLQKSNFMMKFLAWLMWFAVFATVLVFFAVFNAIYGHKYVHRWSGDVYIWFGVFGLGSLCISNQSTVFLLKKARLINGGQPNWMNEFILAFARPGSWLNKVVSIVLIICILSILILVNWGLYLVFPYMTAQ